MKFRESLKEKVSGIFSVFKASEDGAGLQVGLRGGAEVG